VIVAAYSGLVIFYLGRIIGDRQSIAVERRELEDAIGRCLRWIRQHEQMLAARIQQQFREKKVKK
jgi:hypothetical protein